MPRKFCAGDEDHFFRFAQADPFAKHRKVQRFDARQQRIISMHQKPQCAMAVNVDQIEELRAFFIHLPRAVSLKT